jgi:hypothetical protein
MIKKSLLGVGGYAGIETTVGAEKDINVPHRNKYSQKK